MAFRFFYAVFLVVAVLSTLPVDCAHHHHVPAPSPSVDCSTLILEMADCLSYVSTGSNTTKPEGSCCSGLKKVLKTDAECLCEAFKSSAALGVTLNVTKALKLPDACKIKAPPSAKCGLSLPPAGAPGMAPTAGGPSAAGAAGEAVRGPAPAPGNPAYSSGPLSSGALVGVLVFVMFSSF